MLLPWEEGYQSKYETARNKDIREIRFDTVREDKDVAEMFTRLDLKKSWSWIGPQLLAYLATYKLNRNADGKIDGQVFLEENVKGRAWDTGLWRALVRVDRSKIMNKMTTQPNLKCCTLVPIYMAAHKEHNNIKYSEWTNIKNIVPAKLYEAITSDRIELPSADELLQLRIEGMAGKDPRTYNIMKLPAKHPLDELNNLAKAMVFQIWCAHPNNRNPLMILDPWDPDAYPDPLVPLDPFKTDLPF